MNTTRTGDVTDSTSISGISKIILTLFVLLCSANTNAALQASSASENSITLNWTSPGDDGGAGTAAQYDVRYSTAPIDAGNFDSAGQVFGEPAPQAAGSPESFTVTGLTSGTTYYFAIKTSDEAGNWSGISNIVSATTDSDQTPPMTVADLVTLLPTQTSLTLAWTAPGDDSTSGTASEYDIRYSTAPISNATAWNGAAQISNEPSPSTAGTPESLTVSGLSENQTYYFALKAADELGNWSAMSNVASGSTTPDQTAPGAINDLEATPGPQNGSIDVSWTAPGDDGMLGTVTLYEIRYAYDSITDASWDEAPVWSFAPTPLASGLEQNITLTNLEPGQVYYIGVKAYDDAANASPLSNIDSTTAYYDLSLDLDEDNDNLPTDFNLSQNYPNPFNPTTEIQIAVPRVADAQLVVYNSAGQAVTKLVDGALAAGEHVVSWNGRNDAGQMVATGVYYYRFAAGDFVETKKMMLLK